MHGGQRPISLEYQINRLPPIISDTLVTGMAQGGVQREEGGGHADLLLYTRSSLPRAGGQGCIYLFHFIYSFHFIYLVFICFPNKFVSTNVLVTTCNKKILSNLKECVPLSI